LSDAIAMT